MLLVSLLVVATLHVAVTPSDAGGDGHRSGESWQFEGRIDQIDRVSGDSNQSTAVVWIRLTNNQPVRVVVPTMSIEKRVGDVVRVHGVRGEDHIAAARDGTMHRYLAAYDGVLSLPENVPNSWSWSVVALPLLLGACLFVALNIGRQQRRTRIQRGMADEGVAPDWRSLEGMESSDLPSDPVEALAELARRTDEDHT